MLYIDNKTQAVINRRKAQVANNNWFPIEQEGHYKKRTVSGHRYSCWMCSGRRAKRRLLMELPLDIEE